MKRTVQRLEIEDTNDSRSIDSVVRGRKENIIPPSKSYYRMAQSGSLPASATGEALDSSRLARKPSLCLSSICSNMVNSQDCTV